MKQIIEFERNVPFIEMILCYLRENTITEKENLKEVLEELFSANNLSEKKRRLALATNQPKEKRRRLNSSFRHLIPVTDPKSVIISMEADGTVKMIVLDRTYSLLPKNVTQVSTTRVKTQQFII